MTLIRAFSSVLVVLFTTGSLAAESKFQFTDWDGPDIPVRLFTPENVSPETRIVFVMHGASRDAPRYYKDWKALGEKLSLIVVVPEFSKRSFEGSARYNLGYVFDPDTGQRRPEAEWTFSSIEPLFDDVRRRLGTEQSHYALYGHSAGSQFVHRFMYYKPDARVSRYVAANAGWYTLPVDDIDYPYGLAESGIEKQTLAGIFAKPMVILLGKEDTEVKSSNLRNTPEAREQGANRLLRGLNMYRVAKARAEELGLPFNWEIFVIKGADHNNAKMTPAAAAIAAQ